MRYYWLVGIDPQPESWAFHYRDSKGRVLLHESCKQVGCPKCGKFDELNQLRSANDLPFYCRSKRDFLQTMDGVPLVSKRFFDVVAKYRLTGLSFVQAGRLKDRLVCVVEETTRYDPVKASMRLLGECELCGRYRETLPLPNINSCIDAPSTDFLMIHGDKPKSAWLAIYANERASQVLEVERLTGFTLSSMGNTEDLSERLGADEKFLDEEIDNDTLKSIEADFGPVIEVSAPLMPSFLFSSVPQIKIGRFSYGENGEMYVTIGASTPDSDNTERELALCLRRNTDFREMAVDLVNQAAIEALSSELDYLDYQLDSEIADQFGFPFLVELDYRLNDKKKSKLPVRLLFGITNQEHSILETKGRTALQVELERLGVLPYTDPYRATCKL